MTDPSHPDLPSDDLDQLVSAHLDGATTPEEAARIEADPAARARLAQLRGVRDALRTPTPVDAGARETAVAAALAAFDDERDLAPVTSLAEVAARRSPAPRALRLVGIAAAVLLLAALVPLLTEVGGDDQDDVAGSAADALAESDDAATADRSEGAGDDGGGGDVAEAPATAGAEDGQSTEAADAFGALDQLDDLGAFATVDDLLAAARDEPAAPTTAAAPDEAATFRSDASCLAELLEGSAAEPPITVRGAQLDGQPVLVVESGPPTARTISVVTEQPCRLLAQVPA